MRPEVGAILAASLLLRCAVSQFPYSGFQNKGGTVRKDGTRMFGDYEAQRHWMEITLHTPMSEWYTQTKNNDLLYWGLDYPPLTAYHSWLCGWIFDKIEPAAVALGTSRGYENESSKLMMRTASLVSDLLTLHIGAYIAAAAAFPRGKDWSRFIAAFGLVLLQPGFILIDHGHFQFNSVCLGLTAAAAGLVNTGREGGIGAWQLAGSALFVMSLCYKQIALYYAPAFFFHLLGRSFGEGMGAVKGIANVALLGVVVVASFACAFAPWLSLSSPDHILQVLRRIFPVGRGLYEDKVANFWCAASPVLRFKEWVAPDRMVLISLATTIVAFVPSGLCALRRPTMRNLSWTMLNTSLSFFLFAYQVHEKSILFALLPSCLLSVSTLQLSFQHMALTHAALSSMLPLLRRDGLTLPFVCMLVMSWIVWRYVHALAGNVTSRGGRFNGKGAYIAMLAMLPIVTSVLHVAEYYIPAPKRYPDVHVLALMAFNALVFIAVLVHSTVLQIQETFSVDPAEQSRAEKEK